MVLYGKFLKWKQARAEGQQLQQKDKNSEKRKGGIEIILFSAHSNVMKRGACGKKCTLSGVALRMPF